MEFSLSSQFFRATVVVGTIALAACAYALFDKTVSSARQQAYAAGYANAVMVNTARSIGRLASERPEDALLPATVCRAFLDKLPCSTHSQASHLLGSRKQLDRLDGQACVDVLDALRDCMSTQRKSPK